MEYVEGVGLSYAVQVFGTATLHSITLLIPLADLTENAQTCFKISCIILPARTLAAFV